jgi:hypothetical protein
VIVPPAVAGVPLVPDLMFSLLLGSLILVVFLLLLAFLLLVSSLLLPGFLLLLAFLGLMASLLLLACRFWRPYVIVAGILTY